MTSEDGGAHRAPRDQGHREAMALAPPAGLLPGMHQGATRWQQRRRQRQRQHCRKRRVAAAAPWPGAGHAVHRATRGRGFAPEVLATRSTRYAVAADMHFCASVPNKHQPCARRPAGPCTVTTHAAGHAVHWATSGRGFAPEVLATRSTRYVVAANMHFCASVNNQPCTSLDGRARACRAAIRRA